MKKFTVVVALFVLFTLLSLVMSYPDSVFASTLIPDGYTILVPNRDAPNGELYSTSIQSMSNNGIGGDIYYYYLGSPELVNRMAAAYWDKNGVLVSKLYNYNADGGQQNLMYYLYINDKTFTSQPARGYDIGTYPNSIGQYTFSKFNDSGYFTILNGALKMYPNNVTVPATVTTQAYRAKLDTLFSGYSLTNVSQSTKDKTGRLLYGPLVNSGITPDFVPYGLNNNDHIAGEVISVPAANTNAGSDVNINAAVLIGGVRYSLHNILFKRGEQTSYSTVYDINNQNVVAGSIVKKTSPYTSNAYVIKYDTVPDLATATVRRWGSITWPNSNVIMTHLNNVGQGLLLEYINTDKTYTQLYLVSTDNTQARMINVGSSIYKVMSLSAEYRQPKSIPFVVPLGLNDNGDILGYFIQEDNTPYVSYSLHNFVYNYRAYSLRLLDVMFARGNIINSEYWDQLDPYIFNLSESGTIAAQCQRGAYDDPSHLYTSCLLVPNYLVPGGTIR